MGLVKDRILVLGDLWDRADLVAEVNQDREGQGAQQMDPEVGEVSRNLTCSPLHDHIKQPQ